MKYLIALRAIVFATLILAGGVVQAQDTTQTDTSQAQAAASADASASGGGSGDFANADVSAGETLFTQNCASCHRLNQKLIGPALAGVNQKYEGEEEWLYQWIRNAPGMIAEGDPKAVALWEEYNKQMMTAFTSLTDQDITNILAWVEAETNAPAETASTKVAAGGEGAVDAPIADPKVYYALLALVGVLVLIALLLVFITATLVSATRAKDGKEAFNFKNITTRFTGILQNKFVITAITLLILTGGTWQMIVVGRNVSLHQGYMPDQPIKFSHKLHAGQNQIACEYCHSGVKKSKSAWIPSTNVCMNCHKYIQQGPQYGKEEIAKIYEATGWDPEEAAYVNEPKPVEWIRIHNNPDHAYFNHAQHVAVGNLECQTCHGPVEEMEVVYQYSMLGMGWCINCHREEKVKVLGKDTEYTVADMGGLNCSKCHY